MAKQREEDKEKERFLALSDREKVSTVFFRVEREFFYTLLKSTNS